MGEPWSEEFAAHVRQWCDMVAVLGVDALVDAGLVAKGNFEEAAGIIAEEVFVRLCLRDYPPIPESLDKAQAGGPGAAADQPRDNDIVDLTPPPV